MKQRWFGLLAAPVLLIGACTTTAESDDTTRDENGAVVEGGEVGVLALNVGDCFGDLPVGEIASIEAVPCAEDHRVEIFHTFDVILPVYDSTRVSELAGEGCFEEFEPFVGASYETSFFDYSSLNPTSESWENADDREIVCVVFPYEAGVTTSGTAKNSGLLLELAADAVEASSELSADVFDVAVGDCLAGDTDGQITSVEVVGCEGEHLQEVYHSFDLDLAAFEQDAISAAAVDGCYAEFEAFIGLAYEFSEYDITTISPTVESWKSADREVLCLVYLLDDRTAVGTAQGSGI